MEIDRRTFISATMIFASYLGTASASELDDTTNDGIMTPREELLRFSEIIRGSEHTHAAFIETSPNSKLTAFVAVGDSKGCFISTEAVDIMFGIHGESIKKIRTILSQREIIPGRSSSRTVHLDKANSHALAKDIDRQIDNGKQARLIQRRKSRSVPS